MRARDARSQRWRWHPRTSVPIVAIRGRSPASRARARERKDSPTAAQYPAIVGPGRAARSSESMTTVDDNREDAYAVRLITEPGEERRA
jgi:hypothetical protein